ncbi:hormogonium polysaccharide secretion pseudopilin HpsB [Fischerella sp. JS2]|uniref:hormogonium polysaccharide secretion pseudopilin HpsB n=1 Tax=Fischerella sp. JS2 TaxID=2597771 RepID=UPI0028E6A596|nr:hormogonium polysaccharide secretion pseudopilin HpsB [Fischerella sp. JS2]
MIRGKQATKKSLCSLLRAGSKITQFSQRGFTIVESLVALIVVSILLAAIAPVITLSVATRLQSRRVELASQAARAYIDGVRTKKIDAPNSTGSDDLSTYAAPTATGTLTCSNNSYCTAPTGTSVYCVNFDSTDGCQSTSPTDMVVQGFRYNPTSGSTADNGYALGIRVYRADAFKLSTTLLKNTSTTKTTQNTFTGGAGQRTSPLVEMTTEISDTVPKYSDLCDRIKGPDPDTNPKDEGCQN